jgi:tetratricopeptide repeat protein 30
LDVEALIIVNLCVSYCISDENGSADTLINQLIEEESEKTKDDPNAKRYHLSVIHLVIGTFYCSHHEIDFGNDNMFQAFNSMHTKLNADAWFYAN